jgi:transcription-repair coupling factor (superfamily II helicase)
MQTEQLETVMRGFVAGEVDILVSTMIVESGLDVANANTMVVHDAHRFGLAQLYQLRGRVGRSHRRAYCYLLVPDTIDADAEERLRVLEHHTDLGAGYRIALKDLEIRGAGNLLGTQQSGHIANVGYELYCQLLENAVLTLQKKPPKVRIEVDINLPGDAFLPPEYVSDLRLKIDLYRRLTRVSRYDELEEFRSELIDRFGEPPRPVERLLDLAELKMDALVWQISAIYVEGEFVVFRYDDRPRIEQLVRQHKGKLRLVDEKRVYLPLPHNLDDRDRLWRIVKSVLRPAAVGTTIPRPNNVQSPMPKVQS